MDDPLEVCLGADVVVQAGRGLVSSIVGLPLHRGTWTILSGFGRFGKHYYSRFL